MCRVGVPKRGRLSSEREEDSLGVWVRLCLKKKKNKDLVIPMYKLKTGRWIVIC